MAGDDLSIGGVLGETGKSQEAVDSHNMAMKHS